MKLNALPEKHPTWITVMSVVLICFFCCMSCENMDSRQGEPSVETESVDDESPAYSLTTVTPAETLNVGFLVLDSVYNSELMAPWDIFHHTVFHADPAMQVFSVARDSGVLTTFEGLRMLPDYHISNAPRIDVLVVPSALHNMDSDLQDTELIDWVRERGQAARYLVSLCDGAFILAQAGLLDGLHATTFPGDIDAFEKMFPKIEVHREVSFVHDSKAITSAGGAKSYDPAMFLVEMLYGKKAADGVASGMVIDWDLGSVKCFRADE